MRIARFTAFPMALLLAGCHKQKPPPSIEGLTAALEKTAEQSIAAPSLANEQITLPAPAGQADAAAASVVEAAAAAGGAAIRSTSAQGQFSVLVTLPENNAEAFKAALRHEKAAMAKPSASSRLIEVLIITSAASPTP